MASREGHLMDILSFVHKDSLTPAPALLFNALIANIMIAQVLLYYDIYRTTFYPISLFTCTFQGSIDSLIDFFSFTVWIFYGMAMAALIALRWRRPDIARPYKVPILVPILVLVFSVFLVIAPIVNEPKVSGCGGGGGSSSSSNSNNNNSNSFTRHVCLLPRLSTSTR